MHPSIELSRKADRQRWTYASLIVHDGPRRLKPSQVAHDRLVFRTPPHLTSARVEIVLVNGDAAQRHTAEVLPHDPDATRIPIRLMPGVLSEMTR